ncbi:Uncharacterised protein [Mycobacteroides abscessus subsp. abscessus]|nr:Uncharacterised protein [Mycobacteroides abscessus subsp. abscessus]
MKKVKCEIISMYLNILHRHNNIKCINLNQISTNNLTTMHHIHITINNNTISHIQTINNHNKQANLVTMQKK